MGLLRAIFLVAVLPAVAFAASAGSLCTPGGTTALFASYQPEAPDTVFYSEDGCRAGGGRGKGCCQGSACQDCRENQVSSTGGRKMRWYSCECLYCAAGTAQPSKAKRSCLPCPQGWYNLQTGQSTCVPCPPGTYNSAFGLNSSCTQCPVGTFSASTQAQFREATTGIYFGMAGTFNPSAGARNCLACPPGTYQKPLPAGFQNAVLSADQCQPCPPGTYSLAGYSSCLPCPAGTFRVHKGGTSLADCETCPAGATSFKPGSTECEQVCPVFNKACDQAPVQDPGVYSNEPNLAVFNKESLHPEFELSQVLGTEFNYAQPGPDQKVMVASTGEIVTDHLTELLTARCKAGCVEYGTTNWCGESCASCSHPVRDRYKCTLAKNCSMITLPCPGAVVSYLGVPI